MNILIVYAHPEPKSFNGALPKSFNGALKDLAVQVFTEQGHHVEVSDLYAQGFNPVGGPHDFTQVEDPEFFKYGVEQTKASELNTFAPDVVAEQQKLLKADVVIFQFPLWWFGLPAILKGWVDRIFSAGLIYGSGKWYSNGVMKGKKAFVSLTTGGGSAIYSPTGLNGDINSLLFPIQHGMFYFVGFDVLSPFVAWGPARMSEAERAQSLEDYKKKLLNIFNESPIPFEPLEAYDESFQLKDASSLVGAGNL